MSTTASSPWIVPPEKPTAREVSNELSTFVADLHESEGKLRDELKNIKKGAAEIQEEYDDAVATFVENEITELQGEKFDRIDTLSQNVEGLNTQSLGFIRNRAIRGRDNALAQYNANSAETVDADGFRTTLITIQSEIQTLQESVQANTDKLKAARSALSTWNGSTEGKFVIAADEVARRNGKAVSQDNAAFYWPTGTFSGVTHAKNLAVSADYRAISPLLTAYGHGKNGKDAFADLPGWQQQARTLEQAVTDANSALDATQHQVELKDASIQSMKSLAGNIKTDDEILKAVQKKIAEFFGNNDFVTKLGKEVGEDLPRNIPLMAAKLNTLAKLEDGVESKLEVLEAQRDRAQADYRKVSHMNPHQEMPINLEEYRQRNASQVAAYNGYATAANQSWNRTVSYTPSTTIIYEDNSPSFFETMLIADIMSSGAREAGFEAGERAAHQADMNAAYSASLMGIDRADAAQYGLPETAFDAPPGIDLDFVDNGAWDTDTTLSDAMSSVREEPSSAWGAAAGPTRDDSWLSTTHGDGSSPSNST